MIFRFLNIIAITCFVELLILYIFVVKNFLWKFIPVKLYDFENLKNNGFFWEFENISPFRTEGRFSVPDWTETETQKDRTETKTQKTGPRPKLKRPDRDQNLKRPDRDQNSKDWTETETQKTGPRPKRSLTSFIFTFWYTLLQHGFSYGIMSLVIF